MLDPRPAPQRSNEIALEPRLFWENSVSGGVDILPTTAQARGFPTLKLPYGWPGNLVCDRNTTPGHSDEEFAAVMLSALPHMKATPVPMLPLGVRRAAQKKLTRAS